MHPCARFILSIFSILQAPRLEIGEESWVSVGDNYDDHYYAKISLVPVLCFCTVTKVGGIIVKGLKKEIRGSIPFKVHCLE